MHCTSITDGGRVWWALDVRPNVVVIFLFSVPFFGTIFGINDWFDIDLSCFYCFVLCHHGGGGGEGQLMWLQTTTNSIIVDCLS